MKLVHWPLMGESLHLVQRGGDWAQPAVPSSLYQYGQPINCQSRPTNHRIAV